MLEFGFVLVALSLAVVFFFWPELTHPEIAPSSSELRPPGAHDPASLTPPHPATEPTKADANPVSSTPWRTVQVVGTSYTNTTSMTEESKLAVPNWLAFQLGKQWIRLSQSPQLSIYFPQTTARDFKFSSLRYSQGLLDECQ